jgi:predicted regulator of Ras-like GTPase activity (Roadblock/LC7/MglB family)
MIGIVELNKRIEQLLKTFKRRTKCLASMIVDKDGFIIVSNSETKYQNDNFKKQILRVFNQVESVTSMNSDLIDYSTQRGQISVSTVDDYINHGFMILFRQISEDLVFFALFPYLLDIKPIYSEFDKVFEKLAQHFNESGSEENLNQLYNIV